MDVVVVCGSGSHINLLELMGLLELEDVKVVEKLPPHLEMGYYMITNEEFRLPDEVNCFQPLLSVQANDRILDMRLLIRRMRKIRR